MKLHEILKSQSWILIGCCSILDGKNESDAKDGLEEGDATEGDATLPRELERRRRQLRGLEVVERLLGSSPMRELVRMVEETGLAPSTSGGKTGHVRPTTHGKAPTKNF